jgi:hypothetical protein
MQSPLSHWTKESILAVLDKCCDDFTFPMLDNGYVYLAATRMTLHRSRSDWAIVIEVFGFSPRAGAPDTTIHTFSSTIARRAKPAGFVNLEAYERYLANNPHNEINAVFPIEGEDWIESELVAAGRPSLVVRGVPKPMPTPEDYSVAEIEMSAAPRITVFELCRALASTARDDVLATTAERTVNLPAEMHQILKLEDWNHPDIVDDVNRPSTSETFQQLAQVLVSGDTRLYKPTVPPNTHWKNWPEGGTL